MANKNENPNNLFRDKSIERISSPEDLNDYVRVANPGVWLILLAIVVLLVGFAVWAINGELETTVPAVVISADNHTDCFVAESNISKIKEGQTVRVGEEEFKIVSISRESLDSDRFLSDYAKHVSGISDDEWIHAIQLDGEAPEGTAEAQIITESIKPIKFIVDRGT